MEKTVITEKVLIADQYGIGRRITTIWKWKGIPLYWNTRVRILSDEQTRLLLTHCSHEYLRKRDWVYLYDKDVEVEQ